MTLSGEHVNTINTERVSVACTDSGPEVYIKITKCTLMYPQQAVCITATSRKPLNPFNMCTIQIVGNYSDK